MTVGNIPTGRTYTEAFGGGPYRMAEYVCPDRKCDYTTLAEIPPECPAHRRRMVLKRK
jgi:hypothetical protein